MGEETTRCICSFSHHTSQMICCDRCGVWQHAECMNIDKKQLQEYGRKDLEYLCDRCEPRELDYDRARKLQQESRRRRSAKPPDGPSKEDNNSTEGGSSDDDESGLPGYRRPSRDERKAVELERIFQKMNREEAKKRTRLEVRLESQVPPKSTDRKTDSEEDSDKNNVDDLDESEDEQEETLLPGGLRSSRLNKELDRKKRGRPKGSGAKKKKLEEEEKSDPLREKRIRKIKVEEPIRTGVSPTNVPESISLSTHGRGKGRPGRKPGRRPGPKTKFVPFPNQAPSTTDKPKTDEVIKDEPSNEENNQSETESADSGLVDESEAMDVEELTVPIRNPFIKRQLDVDKFKNVPRFGHDIIVTFHDWEWRGGNNSNVLKVDSDSWESSLGSKGNGHFKKQWLMKNTEETKQVPAVDEVVMEELRKRNVDLSTIEGLNHLNIHAHTLNSENSIVPESTLNNHEDSDHSQTSSNPEKIWQPFQSGSATPNAQQGSQQSTLAQTASTSQPDTADGKNQTDANKKGKKLSLADYKKRQMEERKRQEEEHAREEAERQRQQNNRLSTDAVTAVLSSAVEAATNGSRVQTVTSSDVAWLSSLVGINLTGSPTAIGESSQELTKATSERLSDLAQATEQVLNTVRAANVLAALHAQNRYRKMN